MSNFRLDTLGTLRLRRGGEQILVGRRKELVLLAYLAREGPRSAPRVELAELLWDGRDEHRARHSLRQALLRLKREIGDALVIDPEVAGLRNGAVELDASLLEDDVEAGRLDAAAERWSGDFLYGLEDVGGEAYRHWLEGERTLLRRRFSLALELLTHQAEARGAWNEAAQWSERWVRSNPLDETAQLHHLEALLLSGRSSEAVVRHGAFAARLRREVGVEPSAVFHTLGEHLRKSASRTRDEAQGKTTPRSPDIVGRQAVFAELVSAWTEAEGGGSPVLVVHGEEGTGKTRLCEEFVRWLELRGQGACLLQGRARDADHSEPSATLRRLLAALPRATGLAGAPDDALAELVTLVPALKARFPRLPPALGSQVAFERALHSVLSDVAAEVPILLLVDDLPLADRRSREILAALVEDLPASVLVLLTGRTDLLESAGDLLQLRKLAGVRHIRLSPLAAPEVMALIRSIMAPHSHAVGLPQRLFEESGGNPGTVLELIRAMSESRLIAQDPATGGWVPSRELSRRQLPVPGWMRDAWRARLRDLDEDPRTLLEAASTLGHTIDPVSLQNASGLRSGSFAAALDALITRGLLRERDTDPETYEIAQGIVRRILPRRVGPASGHSVQGLTKEAGRGSFPPDVVILPMAFEGAPHHPFLEERAAELLAVALDGAGGLRCAAARLIEDRLSSLSNAAAPHDRDRSVALRQGARWLANARVHSSGDHIRIVLTVTAAQQSARDSKGISVDGTASNLLDLIDRMAVELLLHIRGSEDPHLEGSFRERPSLKVLKHFFAGESALRSGDLDLAIDFFRAAIAADPDFALGYHRLADALEWTYHPESPRWIAEAVSKAATLSHKLPEILRVMVRARHASMRGAAEEAVRLFRSVVSVAPDNAEAWYGLGFNTFHFAQLWGGTVGDARQAFERVLALRPDAIPAAAYLASIAAVEKKGDELVAMVQKLLDHDQRSVHISMGLAARVQLAYGLPDADLQQRVLEEVRHGTEADLAALVLFPLLTGDDIDAASRGFPLMTEPGRSPQVRATGHTLLAAVELGRGRWRACKTQLEQARQFDAQAADEYWALFACAPFLVPCPEELRGWRKATSEGTLQTPTEPERPFPFAPHAPLHPVMLAYTTGVVAVPLGDWEAAEAAAESLDRIGDVDGMGGLGRALAQRIRARAFAARDQPEAALAALALHTPEIPWHWLAASGLLCGAHERFLRGEQLMRLGRLAEAKPWFSASVGLSSYDVVLWGPVALKLGEIAEAEKDFGSAALHYSRFLSLWSECDAELQPIREDVARRLDRLPNQSSRSGAVSRPSSGDRIHTAAEQGHPGTAAM